MTHLIQEYHDVLLQRAESDTLTAVDKAILFLTAFEDATPYPIEEITSFFDAIRDNIPKLPEFEQTLLYSAMLNSSSLGKKLILTEHEWQKALHFESKHPELTAFLTDSLALTSTVLYGPEDVQTLRILEKLQPLVPYIQYIVDKNKEGDYMNNPFILTYITMHERLKNMTFTSHESPSL